MTLPISETPTQYDLARWLFLKVEQQCGPITTRNEIISLMYECLVAIRPAVPAPEPKPPRGL